MIKGTGIDITLIERMAEKLDNRPFMEKIFTDYELEYINSKTNRAQTAAGLFCAKEACLKAYGRGLGGISFHDMEVRHDERGTPKLYCKEPGILHLSISHSGDVAIAQVIVESED